MEKHHEIKMRKPDANIDGLAVFSTGVGEPILLFPYPHGATHTQMCLSPIHDMLVDMGRRVITFDPPQAYASTREANYGLQEMLECGIEALRHFGITEPVDVAGHSMGGFCTLAMAVEYPERVKKVAVICGNPGFKTVRKQWFASKVITGFDFLKLTWYGFVEIIGFGSLKNHKRLNNLIDYHIFHDKSKYVGREIYKDDKSKKAPLRDQWMNAIRHEDYMDRLSEIEQPVLLISGVNDILSAKSVNEAMAERIKNSQLVVFDKSGHFPYVEEKDRLENVLDVFLNKK